MPDTSGSHVSSQMAAGGVRRQERKGSSKVA